MIDVCRFPGKDGGHAEAVAPARPRQHLPPAAPRCPCTPVRDDAASPLKALADPARLRLVSILLASDGQEACTCELTEPLGLSQPTVSHHLKKLAEAGLITGERRGVWTYYRVVPDALSALAAVLLTPQAA